MPRSNSSRISLANVVGFIIGLVIFQVACASFPDPKPVYDDAEATLVDFVDEIEAGRWVPVLAEGVEVENPKKELANMKRRRLERLRHNIRTIQSARGK